MKIFKSYGFWTAFAGAVVILVNSLGQLFGFSIESQLIENVILAFAGVLVALGVVSMEKAKTVDDKADENQSTEEAKTEKEDNLEGDEK